MKENIKKLFQHLKIQWKLRIASVRYHAFCHTVHSFRMILTKKNTTYINNKLIGFL